MWKYNFKNAEALLSLLGPCSKNETISIQAHEFNFLLNFCYVQNK